MTKILEIEDCSRCPNFNYEYYSYKEECIQLCRKIAPNQEGNYPIPEDCPLESKQDD